MKRRGGLLLVGMMMNGAWVAPAGADHGRYGYGRPPREANWEMPSRSMLGGNAYHLHGQRSGVPVVPVRAYRPSPAPFIPTAPYASRYSVPPGGYGPAYPVPPQPGAPCATAPVNVNVQVPPHGPLEAGRYVGRGILGQPTIYAKGQPVRNFFRAFTP